MTAIGELDPLSEGTEMVRRPRHVGFGVQSSYITVKPEVRRLNISSIDKVARNLLLIGDTEYNPQDFVSDLP